MFFREMANKYPTVFWHDSCIIEELKTALSLGATGSTSNQPLILKAVLAQQQKWSGEVVRLLTDQPSLSDQEIAFKLRDEMVGLIAAELMGIFIRSNKEAGLLSVQVDPCRYSNVSAMVEEAIRIYALAPNLSVKIPATAAGLKAIEVLTEYGVNTTATVSFTVSQVVEVAQAYDRGLQKLRDKPKPKSFAVIMAGRLDDHLKDQVRELNIDIQPHMINQAGVAVVKNAYRIFSERKYESALLIAGMRGNYHVTEFVGGKLILTVSPAIQQAIEDSGAIPQNSISNNIPGETLERLECIFPDFNRAYQEQELNPDEMEHFGPSEKTLTEFINAQQGLIDFIHTIRIQMSEKSYSKSYAK